MKEFPRLRDRLWSLRNDLYADRVIAGRPGTLGDGDVAASISAQRRIDTAVEEIGEIEYVLEYFEHLHRPWPREAVWAFRVLIVVISGLVAWNIWLHF